LITPFYKKKIKQTTQQLSTKLIWNLANGDGGEEKTVAQNEKPKSS